MLVYPSSITNLYTTLQHPSNQTKIGKYIGHNLNYLFTIFLHVLYISRPLLALLHLHTTGQLTSIISSIFSTSPKLSQHTIFSFTRQLSLWLFSNRILLLIQPRTFPASLIVLNSPDYYTSSFCLTFSLFPSLGLRSLTLHNLLIHIYFCFGFSYKLTH